jgi:peptidyl-prolyl cis-trans isomerase D
MEQAIFKDQAQAQAAADQVKKGTALKTAAHNVKDASYLGQESFQKAGLDPAIAEPAFAAAKKDVVGPIQTALGWHVLVVKDILTPSAKPFAEVKEKLRQDLLNTRLSDELYKMSGKIDDQAANGTPLEEIAKDMGLIIKKYGPVRADGSTPDSHDGFKDYPKDRETLLKTAFEQEEGETAPIQELKDGSYAAIRVDHITPKSYKPFADVKQDIRKTWIADQQDVLNKEKAQEALTALDTGKKTLDQIAADNHLQAQTQTLKRGDNPAPPFTPTAKGKFFEIAKSVNAAASTRGGYMIGTLTAIRLPDTDKLPAAALKDINGKAVQGLQNEFLLSYAEYLRKKYGVTINSAVLEKMYGGDKDNGETSN